MDGKMTKFEAAALYDFENNLVGIRNITEVILDTDTLEIGICNLEEGNVSFLGKTSQERNRKEIENQMTGGHPFLGIFEAEWNQQQKQMNEQLEKYYRSSKQIDETAFHIPALDIEWKCAQLERQFEPVRDSLIQSFEETEKILNQNHVEEEKIRVVLIGERADYFLFLYTVKDYFSFDPFLKDNRFSEKAICENGNDLLKEIEKRQLEKQRIGHDIQLVFYELSENQELEKKTEVLSRKSQLLNEFQQVRYLQPIFIEKGGSVNLEVDGAKKTILLPSDNQKEAGEALEVGLFVNEKNIFIRFRTMKERTKQFDVKLFS